jgi:hypothetical protein
MPMCRLLDVGERYTAYAFLAQWLRPRPARPPGDLAHPGKRAVPVTLAAAPIRQPAGCSAFIELWQRKRLFSSGAMLGPASTAAAVLDDIDRAS